MAFILRRRSHEERFVGGEIDQLWDDGRPDESHNALGCIAATGRMESKRFRADAAADGTRDLITSTTTDADKDLLQQQQKAEHTECQEQCSAAASKCECLQQVRNALTAEKIENFSREQMSERAAAAKSAS